MSSRILSKNQREELLQTLRARFEENMGRHKGLRWADVQTRLEAGSPAGKGKLLSLHEMENTGGEPDVIGRDRKTGEYIFCDCSPETPAGRRNTCYDREGQVAREKQEIYPDGNAVDMASAIDIEILTEEQYRALQELGEFDTKTSSWVQTPPAIRKLGGALFCDRRYGQVFVYHNGAPSFYRARGFRGLLRV